MLADSDNNRTLRTGAFGLLFGIAVSAGCSLVVKSYWPAQIGSR